MADAPPLYRLEWRHRAVARDGRAGEVTRALVAADGAELKLLGARVANEAVGREFVIRLIATDGGGCLACVRAEELAAWKPAEGCLPRGTVRTYWEEDEHSGAQRYRLLTAIAAAFDEARSLRLVGRHESRDIMKRVRGALLRP